MANRKRAYANELYEYPKVAEVLRKSNPTDTYTITLLVAQQVTGDYTEGGYATQVADRAWEWRLLRDAGKLVQPITIGRK